MTLIESATITFLLHCIVRFYDAFYFIALLINIICLCCPGKTSLLILNSVFYHNFFNYIECLSDLFWKNFINNSNNNNTLNFYENISKTSAEDFVTSFYYHVLLWFSILHFPRCLWDVWLVCPNSIFYSVTSFVKQKTIFFQVLLKCVCISNMFVNN